jgi:hypothetical protein
MFNQNTEYEILTPTGWQDFRGITQTHDKLVYRLTFANGLHIDATPNHHFFIQNQKIKVADLNIGESLDTELGRCEIVDITKVGDIDVYDIVEVSDINHQFFISRCFITKNCDELAFVPVSIAESFFVSILPTLSTGGKMIITSTPNSDEDQFATIWKESQNRFDEYGNEVEDQVGSNGFYGYTAPWDAHPDRDEEWKQNMISQIGVEKFRREYQCLGPATIVTIQDESGNIFDVSIEELYREYMC